MGEDRRIRRRIKRDRGREKIAGGKEKERRVKIKREQ